MSWRLLNRCVYRLASRLRSLRERPPRRAVAAAPEGDGLLYLTWGRLGDAILASPFTAGLRRLCSGPVVAVGRPEAAAILGPQVDRFVAYDRVDPADLGAPFAAVVADPHVFHGGLAALGSLLAEVAAVRRFAYEGYAPRQRLAPCRGFPEGVTVVPGLRKDDAISDPERVHVWNDLEHFHGAVARALGAPAEEPGRPCLEPDREEIEATLGRFGLERGGYWACQPTANIAKKDYPLESWQEIFAAFPDRRFALLGTASQATRNERLGVANTMDLAGHTSIRDALALIAGAAGFVGIDSGLTHAAVAAGASTVYIAQNANLGFFFPYPKRLGATNLRVVHHTDYEACAGCFSICEHEPLWTTYRRGALCLRTLPPDRVIEALRDAPPARAAGRTQTTLGEPLLRAR